MGVYVGVPLFLETTIWLTGSSSNLVAIVIVITVATEILIILRGFGMWGEGSRGGASGTDLGFRMRGSGCTLWGCRLWG